ncbi:MAG TPA: DUF3421 domain-containing protein [Legionella sp.]|nr:DUF3421 domain-containing protein [Legionella sp.]
MSRFITGSLIALISVNLNANPSIHHHPSSPLAQALRVGMDSHGSPLYLCKARLLNGVVLGKTWAGYGRCVVAYNGKELSVTQFTIPNQREFGHYTWERGAQDAMVIGQAPDGKPLFLCQTNFNGTIQPGTSWPGYNHCNISVSGREVITNNYRILSKPREIIVRVQPPTVHRHSNPQSNFHSHN